MMCKIHAIRSVFLATHENSYIYQQPGPPPKKNPMTLLNGGEALGVRQLAAALLFAPGATIAARPKAPQAGDHHPSPLCASTMSF
jgi:hypothetical protein